MTTRYLPLISELLNDKYPDPQNQESLQIQNIRFKVFLFKTTLLLSQYQQIKSLSITHCDLRNLENFPKLQKLQELDLGFNQIQGTFNNLMPLKKLKYINLENNIIFQVSKLAPLKKIAQNNHEKSSSKLSVCIRNNPFTNEDVPYLTKLKGFNFKVVKQPKEYFEKKKQEEQKNSKKASTKKSPVKSIDEESVKKQIKQPWYQVSDDSELISELSSIINLETTRTNNFLAPQQSQRRQENERFNHRRINYPKPNLIETINGPARIMVRLAPSAQQDNFYSRNINYLIDDDNDIQELEMIDNDDDDSLSNQGMEIFTGYRRSLHQPLNSQLNQRRFGQNSMARLRFDRQINRQQYRQQNQQSRSQRLQQLQRQQQRLREQSVQRMQRIRQQRSSRIITQIISNIAQRNQMPNDSSIQLRTNQRSYIDSRLRMDNFNNPSFDNHTRIFSNRSPFTVQAVQDLARTNNQMIAQRSQPNTGTVKQFLNGESEQRNQQQEFLDLDSDQQIGQFFNQQIEDNQDIQENNDDFDEQSDGNNLNDLENISKDEDADENGRIDNQDSFSDESPDNGQGDSNYSMNQQNGGNQIDRFILSQIKNPQADMIFDLNKEAPSRFNQSQVIQSRQGLIDNSLANPVQQINSNNSLSSQSQQSLQQKNQNNYNRQ